MFREKHLKEIIKSIVGSKKFEIFITIVILINSILIGIETYIITPTIYNIQHSILIIFIIEIVLRFYARESTKEYFQNGWNIFDIIIVSISLVPDSLFEDSAFISIMRILRVFRVLRLIKTNRELRIIIDVLSRSVKSLFYNSLFFFIFFYLFAIIGTDLFKLPHSSSSLEVSKKIKDYYEIAPNSPISAPDPYSTLGESFFTLFRIMTEEDWTDICYNLIIASEMGIITSSKSIIVIYHVLWIIISSFLLLNLIVGAILSNYQTVQQSIINKKQLKK